MEAAPAGRRIRILTITTRPAHVIPTPSRALPPAALRGTPRRCLPSRHSGPWMLTRLADTIRNRAGPSAMPPAPGSWAGRCCGPRPSGWRRSWSAGRSCGWWPWFRSWAGWSGSRRWCSAWAYWSGHLAGPRPRSGCPHRRLSQHQEWLPRLLAAAPKALLDHSRPPRQASRSGPESWSTRIAAPGPEGHGGSLRLPKPVPTLRLGRPALARGGNGLDQHGPQRPQRQDHDLA